MTPGLARRDLADSAIEACVAEGECRPSVYSTATLTTSGKRRFGEIRNRIRIAYRIEKQLDHGPARFYAEASDPSLGVETAPLCISCQLLNHRDRCSRGFEIRKALVGYPEISKGEAEVLDEVRVGTF